MLDALLDVGAIEHTLQFQAWSDTQFLTELEEAFDAVDLPCLVGRVHLACAERAEAHRAFECARYLSVSLGLRSALEQLEDEGEYLSCEESVSRIRQHLNAVVGTVTISDTQRVHRLLDMTAANELARSHACTNPMSPDNRAYRKILTTKPPSTLT